MKNLFQSASCGNPAKNFIYMGIDSMGSSEKASTETNSVDFTLPSKEHQHLVDGNDPDVDEDFMAQIESQEKEPPYAKDVKELVKILKEIGAKEITGNDSFHPTETYYKEITNITNIENSLEKIHYTLSTTGGHISILTIKTDSSKYSVLLAEEYQGEYKGPQQEVFNKLSFADKNQWFSLQIKGLLSELKNNSNKEETEGKLTPGMRKAMGLDN